MPTIVTAGAGPRRRRCQPTSRHPIPHRPPGGRGPPWLDLVNNSDRVGCPWCGTCLSSATLTSASGMQTCTPRSSPSAHRSSRRSERQGLSVAAGTVGHLAARRGVEEGGDGCAVKAQFDPPPENAPRGAPQPPGELTGKLEVGHDVGRPSDMWVRGKTRHYSGRLSCRAVPSPSGQCLPMRTFWATVNTSTPKSRDPNPGTFNANAWNSSGTIRLHRIRFPADSVMRRSSWPVSGVHVGVAARCRIPLYGIKRRLRRRSVGRVRLFCRCPRGPAPLAARGLRPCSRGPVRRPLVVLGASAAGVCSRLKVWEKFAQGW
jgi:hypothetical protein